MDEDWSGMMTVGGGGVTSEVVTAGEILPLISSGFDKTVNQKTDTKRLIGLQTGI